MREKDRQLSRRRHRRLKRLKKKGQEDHQLRTERAAGSKRALKKPPGPAEAAAGATGPSEVPAEGVKKPAAKKAPAKKAPAKKPPEESAEGGSAPPPTPPEEPKEP
jgi:trigger factor